MKLSIYKKKADKLKEAWKWEYYETVRDILEHPIVQEMKQYTHHCGTDCFQHCLNVSYYNYYICKLFGWDARSAARAGMLHDLFLYDWRGHSDKTGNRVHAMTHPKAALRNAEQYFKLNRLEKEIILRHMWPVSLIPPLHAESFLITMTDKYCGICEFTEFYQKKWKKIGGRKICHGKS